jgi:PAS domain S-box-containing protein
MLGAFLAASQFLAHRESLMVLRKSRLSEKTLADMISHAPVGIARVNTELKVIAANPSLGGLLREPPEVIAGSSIIKYASPEAQPQMRQGLDGLSSGRSEVIESEVPIARADGSLAWVGLTATAVKKSNGEVDYLLAMLQDTTARHEAEEVSRTNLAELERLNRLKTEFLQSISHEFKTALIGIEGFSELMGDAPVCR